MDTHLHKSLARLKPRPGTIYCSQGRAVLATNLFRVAMLLAGLLSLLLLAGFASLLRFVSSIT
jgi:hypothetical protein